MKELQLSSMKPRITRKNLEIATVVLLALCAVFTFIGRMNSKEVLTLDNGKIKYEGYVVASKMNGQGKLTFENGDAYEGNSPMEFSMEKEPISQLKAGPTLVNSKMAMRMEKEN